MSKWIAYVDGGGKEVFRRTDWTYDAVPNPPRVLSKKEKRKESAKQYWHRGFGKINGRSAKGRLK